jgi:hypothetical protein
MSGQQHAQLDDLSRAPLFLREATVEEGGPAQQHLDGSSACNSSGHILEGTLLRISAFLLVF